MPKMILYKINNPNPREFDNKSAEKIVEKFKELEEEKTVAWTKGFSAGLKDANKTADIRIKELKDKIGKAIYCLNKKEYDTIDGSVDESLRILKKALEEK